MNSKEIIDYLKSEASEKYKENVIKMGIPEKFCIGVSTSTLRKFAKKLDKSNELAFELWNTHYHEARLLAVLIFDHKCLSYDQIDTLIYFDQREIYLAYLSALTTQGYRFQ